jgi:predicted nucleic acid-binding protein
MVLEYEEVLSRSELNLNLTEKEIERLLNIICLLGMKHEIWYLWRPLSSDAKDDFVAELAINAQVDAIVTHNVKDFVNLNKFGIKVVTPKEFLELLGE